MRRLRIVYSKWRYNTFYYYLYYYHIDAYLIFLPLYCTEDAHIPAVMFVPTPCIMWTGHVIQYGRSTIGCAVVPRDNVHFVIIIWVAVISQIALRKVSEL